MYAVAVKRAFDARHFLIGGDWGPENELHSHHYQVEVQLEGQHLDQHGFLVDIVDIESHLENQVERYLNQVLNDLPEFSGLNPSIENFARIICQNLSAAIRSSNLSAISIALWENDIAWASFRQEYT
jgi:6-pyruvoyltetrahydropterin/6-carboxytetrahydropterin synthase